MTYYQKMFSQNETVFHFEIQHAGTRFIKGSAIHTNPKRASYWNMQQKTIFNLPNHIAYGVDPCTALTDRGMKGMDITISPNGTVLA